MHEYGLAEGVLATVRQRADGRTVAGIRVRFGVRHAVDAESLSQAFGFVAAVVVIVVSSLPEIKRYFEIRDM